MFRYSGTLQAPIRPNSNMSDLGAQNKVWCNGRCGTALSEHLIALENAGCSTWDAFRARKVRYDPICATVRNTTSNTDLYCGAVFSEDKYRGSIREIRAHAAGTSSAMVAADEAALAHICTPCFHEFVRLTYRYSTSPTDTLHVDRLRALEALCVRDGSRFCYPRYHNQTRATADADRATSTTALCDSTFMGRCAARMQARELIQTSDSSQRTVLAAEIESMCLTNAGGTLCGRALAPIIGGFNAVGGGAFNTSRQAMYTGPADGKCIGVASVRHTCTWGCQTSLTADRTSFGCCAESTRSLLTTVGYTDVPQAFNNADTLAASCNRPTDAACVVIDDSAGVITSLVLPVPIRVLEPLSPSMEAAVVADLQRTLGTTARGFSVLKYRSLTKTTSLIEFMVFSTSKMAATEIVAQMQADVLGHRVVFLETSQVYNADCHQFDGSACGPDIGPIVD